MKKEWAKPEYAKMKLVATVYGDDVADKSYRETQGLIKAYPNLKGIIAPTSVGIVAAAKAVVDAGLVGKVYVTGLGLPSEMKGAVLAGATDTFAIWNPIDLGYSATMIAALIAEGKATGAAGNHDPRRPHGRHQDRRRRFGGDVRSVHFRQVEYREVRQDILTVGARRPLPSGGGRASIFLLPEIGLLWPLSVRNAAPQDVNAAAPILSVSGVSKRFPGVRALHNVSLALRPGEVTALIGENGAGKSTLVKILTGIYQPDEGEILVSGRPLKPAPDRATPGPPALRRSIRKP